MKTIDEKKIINKAYARWLKAFKGGVNAYGIYSLKMPHIILSETACQVSKDTIKSMKTNNLLKKTFLLALLLTQHKEIKISY